MKRRLSVFAIVALTVSACQSSVAPEKRPEPVPVAEATPVAEPTPSAEATPVVEPKPGIEPSITTSPVPEGAAYVGSGKCKKCHLKQFKSWSETKMARSFESLKSGAAKEAKTGAGLDPDRDYSTDRTCVPCHSTGHGKPGGFVDEATTPDLAGVGCESCHGPGGRYLADDAMSLNNKEYKRKDLVALGLVEVVGKGQCIGCHNERSPFNSAAFDFEKAKDTGTHEHLPLKYDHR